MSELGQRIKQARLDKGMNQHKLAQEMGLTQASISQFEKGQRLPTPANISKLAAILEVDEKFLAGEEEKQHAATVLMRTVDGLDREGIRDVTRFAEFIKKRKREGSDT